MAPLSSAPPDKPISRRTAWWTVGVLSFVAVLDWADRALISAIAEPVKQEFDLSDAQLGFAMGFAMVIMRVVIGVPIGRLSDSWNRRNVLALSLGFWSLMTIATGMAKNFTQFIGARLGVGAGTAGSYPPTLSMLGDLFPLKKRGVALGIWSIGTTIGFSVGLAAGAVIAEHYGWRTAALSFGAVGIAVAMLLFVIVKEPVRRNAVGTELGDEKAPSTRSVIAFISGQRSLLHTIWGFILLNFIEGAQNYWTQSFYVRTHGLSIGEAGSALAGVWLVSGIIGTFLGGYLMDHLGRRDLRWHTWLPGLAGLICFGILREHDGLVNLVRGADAADDRTRRQPHARDVMGADHGDHAATGQCARAAGHRPDQRLDRTHRRPVFVALRDALDLGPEPLGGSALLPRREDDCC
jgi:predicted MFS family arabinose efflux permease